MTKEELDFSIRLQSILDLQAKTQVALEIIDKRLIEANKKIDRLLMALVSDGAAK